MKSEEKGEEPRAAVAKRSALTQVATGVAGPISPLVVAPGGQVIWRIGAGGVIARSDDAGATWRDQTTVEGKLLAGSAVSVGICWAAGRAGAVWRTVDGEHWQQVAVPVDADLVG